MCCDDHLLIFSVHCVYKDTEYYMTNIAQFYQCLLCIVKSTHYSSQAQWEFPNIELGTKRLKMLSREALRKDVSKLLVTTDKLNVMLATRDALTNEVIIYLDVFCTGMENRISSQVDSRGIVTPDNRRTGESETEFL